MAYNPLSVNPLGVLSRYGADNITSATPRKLREYLLEARQLLKDWQIELPQPLGAEVQDAFSHLEGILRAAMKREDSKEKKDALRELNRWQKNYTNDFRGVETQTLEPRAIAVYGGGLENVPIVSDPLYLAKIDYFKGRQQQERLPISVKERLDLFIGTMSMYAKSPTEEGLMGIRKATVEGYILASYFGVDFLDTYGPQINSTVSRFVETCLAKPHGHDNSAHAIAESGLPIQDKEDLFIDRVDLAKRMIEGFGGSLYDKFGEELTRAVAAYANRINHDIGTLVQQLQSEQDPEARQKIVDEMAALRDSAERVGGRYKIPIPPPRINVQHFQLPRPPSSATLTDRLGQ